MTALPLPSIQAQAHSEQLRQRLFQDISQKGWVSFAEFMHRALYEPGLGYYVSGSKKLGSEGDFITAPEISALFSHCLARQCQQVLSEIPAGAILEFGAGSGIMALDILLALEKSQTLPEKYYILEVSPDLQERQRILFEEKCPHLLPSIAWVSQVPIDFEGIILANEVLDAMPVHLFEIQDGEILEKGVAINGDQLIWKTRAATSAQVMMAKRIEKLEFRQFFAEAYSSEICLAIKPWLQSLYDAIKRGVVLFIDYGFPEHEYYHPDRDQGTLICHYRHRAHADPFIFLGLQDITAHVDFSAVAQASVELGFLVAGYTHQANFLMALGILASENIESSEIKEHYQQAQAIKKLLLPSEMGELFKVLALSKALDIPLQGFSLKDDRYRL